MATAGPADILVLSFTDHARDPRVHRQIRFLASSWRLATAGAAPSGVDGIPFYRLQARPKPLPGRLAGLARLAAGRYESYYWGRAAVRQALAAIPPRPARLIIANDIDTLPLALRLADGAPVLFDAHEYAPAEFEELWRFRLLEAPLRRYLCRTYIPRVAAMTTVGEAIAERYREDTGVAPEVLLNAFEYQDLAPRARRPGEPVRLVHHGGAMPTRRLELTIRAVQQLGPGYELHFYLVVEDRAYDARLRALTAGDPRFFFHEPVPFGELPRTLQAYDVGVFLLPPTSFNARYAVPNKIFEFVQARLAVAVGPSPEMARLVTRHGFGVVADDFTPEAFARCLAGLDEDRLRALRERAHAAARDLSADRTREQLRALAARLLSNLS